MIKDGEWVAVEAEDPVSAKDRQCQRVVFIGRVRTAKLPHVDRDGHFSHGHPDQIEKLCVVTALGWPMPVPASIHRECEQTAIEALRIQGELKETDA